MNEFPGTGAPWRADLNLVLQLLMGGVLLLGMWLARRQRFRAHGICQAAVMLLNLPLIALVMYPAFQRSTLPRLGAGFGKPDVLITTLHAGLGLLAELMGLYVILVAGTKLLPAAWRFQNYKRWMRATLGLWWLVIAFGLGTYYQWYLKAAAPKPVAATTQTGNDQRTTIRLSNFKFEPKEVTIAAGTTVEWIDEQGNHSIVADDGSFESDILDAGGRFEHRYEKPGRFPYYCSLHGEKGGHEMAGLVIVQ
ncbi:MAG: hypothetical protein HYR56_20080 [Acidobacteria bacterium]|nr:hypothetical protein [Acidobacteriota bacterium]MBI3424614.1 hypothetical protein [Acidobacteriota bacterium]